MDFVEIGVPICDGFSLLDCRYLFPKNPYNHIKQMLVDEEILVKSLTPSNNKKGFVFVKLQDSRN